MTGIRAVVRDPLLWLIGLIGLADLLFLGVWLGGYAPAGGLDRWTGAGSMPAWAIVLLASVALRHAGHLDPVVRPSWTLIGAGVAVYGTGAVCHSAAAAGVPVGDMGTLLELAAYPLVGAAVVRLARPMESTEGVALFWLDVAIVAWSTAMVVWHFVFFDVAQESSDDLISTVGAVIFPVADLSLVFGAGAVVLRGVRGGSQVGLAVAGVSLLFLFGGDMLSGVDMLRRTYVQGGVSGFCYAVAWLGLALACYLEWREIGEASPGRAREAPRILGVLPYAAVAVAFVAPLLKSWNDLGMLQQHVPATGVLMALVVTRLGVTARQNASLAVAERVRLAAAVEQAAEAILTTDRGWRVTYANSAVERITGYSVTEVVGQDLSILRVSGAQDRPVDMRADVERGRPWQGRFSQQRRDGSTVELDMAVSPLRDGSLNVVGSVVVARDITRERGLESQLAHAQRLEAVGRLAGGIAHDFNNILTAISGYSELAALELPDDHPARADLGEIVRATDRAAELTRALLDFGRRQVLKPQALDINEVLRNLAPMLERVIGEDVALRISHQSDLGPVLADPAKLEQVILNLVVNARDAMPTGGRLALATSNVEIDPAYANSHPGTAAGRYVALTVSDTGAGMSREVLENAFEPFFTTKSPGKGSGLGLATVHGIVTASGGFVLVESSPGKGSSFSIYLPLASEAAARQARSQGTRSLPGGSETILVAEDEAAVRRLVEKVLKAAGYQVTVAANGHEAVALAGAMPKIDLLFTDVVMPGMSGVQLAATMTAERPSLRVVFASGYAGRELDREGEEPARIPYLPKPYTQEALLARIREALDNPPAQRAP
jgi:two-component system cell cycle sensor histidine kinase/response regulator CckA